MLNSSYFKIVWAFIAYIFLLCPVMAQQQGQYSQYMVNYFLINPAASGLDNQIDLRAGYRFQWAGLSGSPKNYYFTAHAPLNRTYARGIGKNKKRNAYHVLGGGASGQSLGALTHNTFYLTYAYHIPLSRDWSLSAGIMAGINQFGLNQNKLDFGDYIPDAATGNINKINPHAGAGLWLYSDRFFFGLSSTQILQSDLGASNNQLVKGMLNRLYFFTAGYNMQLNRELSFVPSILLKQTSTAFQLDLNAKVKYMNFLWGGVSYRRIDAVSFLGGIILTLSGHSGKLKSRGLESAYLEIGYSYDLITSRLSHFSYGSHEIMVALILPKKGKLVCPSHFW
jgi:type IX secretion system PorP/SprF family membrane protein